MSQKFWGYFISAIGVISSIVTLISFVFQWHDPTCIEIVFYLFVVFVLSWLYACWQTEKPSSVSLHISNTLRINIHSGDLFAKKPKNSFVVIPVNEYFDTLVNETVISASSIHGMFINKYYKDNPEQLHSEIQKYLWSHDIKSKKVNRSNSAGYDNQYPLGTCAVIRKDEINFVLVALSHFDNEDHAFVELSEFGRCISQMCTTLSSIADNKPVYMPLMGMGLSRLNQTAQFILKYTLDTIAAIKGLAINGDLNIEIYGPMIKTLDLGDLKY